MQGGGSGINLIISKYTLKNITPIVVYFRQKKAVIEVKQHNYVARFKTEINQPNTIVFNNQEDEKFPFTIQDDEAVISYLQEGETQYLKLANIPEKEMLAYPSAPPNR